MVAKPIRVGAVGYGYWGPNLLRNLERLPDAALVAACDVSEANLSRLKGVYPHVATTTDVDELLRGFDLDAVIVSSPAPTHHEIGMKVLRSGRHCFVEKPLALTSADAEELVAEADSRNLALMVGHIMVYHSAIRWVKECIDSGELGEVLYVYSQRLNLGKVRSEENAFWSLAPHDVSTILHLLGETPDVVSATGAHYLQHKVHDVVFANLNFPSGRTAHIHVSWLDPHKVRKLTVVGSKKMLVFDDMEATEKVWIFDRGVEPKRAMAYGEDLALRFGDIRVPYIALMEPLATEVQHFLDCCADGGTPQSDGHDGLRVVRVLEAVDGSMERGGTPVEIATGS